MSKSKDIRKEKKQKKKKKTIPAANKSETKKRLVIPKKALIEWSGKPNPAHENRGGRFKRIEKLKTFSGKTVAAYKAKNGDAATLRNAIHDGLVRVVP